MSRQAMKAIFCLVASATAAALAFAPHALGQGGAPSRATTRAAAAPSPTVRPELHLHRETTAFGRIDLGRLRSFRHFRSIIRHEVRQLDAPTAAVSRVRSMLERTETVHISLVPGPGRTAEIGTVLLRGDYLPNEVPDTLQSLLPGVLQVLWHQTRIAGRPAYDVGVGALVQLSARDWLIARRIGDELPVTPGEVPAALRSAEYLRMAEQARFGEGAAGGALVGGPDSETAQLPPSGLGFLYHRTKTAFGHLALGDTAEARFAFEMHSIEGARWRAEYFRDVLGRLARGIRDERGGGGTPLRHTVEQEGTGVRVTVTLDPEQVDAYVARFLAGRLLSDSAPAEPRSAAGQPSEQP